MDLPEYTKYYIDENDAESYEELMIVQDWKMPFFVYRERKLAIIEDDNSSHFVLDAIEKIQVSDQIFTPVGNEN